MRFPMGRKTDKNAAGRRGTLRARKPQLDLLEQRALLSTFTVTNPNDNGANGYIVPNSLRWAIIESNANPAKGDVNHIDFGTAGVIQLQDSLPEITAPVLINGFTAPGAHENTLFHGNDSVHTVELMGEGAYTGLYIGASNVTVEGLEIAHFQNDGITIYPEAQDTVIRGDLIDNNGGAGVRVLSSNNVIGGEVDPSSRNVIFANEGSGIEIDGSPANPAENNFVGNNWIGDWAGNNGAGIRLDGARSTQVGGPANALAGNVIDNNGGPGVIITGDGAQYNSLGGNDIHGNYDGVYVAKGASYNFIGTYQPQWSNSIHENGFYGVVLASGTTNNYVSENSIYDNYVGIQLGKTANGGLKPPVVTSAVENASSMTITGSFHGEANTAYEIDFYDSPDMDHYRDEGMNYLHAIGVVTNAQGNASFVVQVPKTVKVGDAITAEVSGDGSSAFSQPAYVTKSKPRRPLPGVQGMSGETLGGVKSAADVMVPRQDQSQTEAALQAYYAELDAVLSRPRASRVSR